MALIKLLYKQYFQMIFDAPINHPAYRFYAQNKPVSSYQEIMPPNIQRYAKFRAQPVNLNKLAPSTQNINNSKVYMKNGLLKRNDIGWDGVKLTEYVTEQLSEDYLKNHNILQKFRQEAEQNRKARFSHVHRRQPYQKQQYLFPQISPIVNGSINAESRIIYQSDEENELGPEVIRYRNVGINTNNNKEKIQAKNYAKMMDRYERLKEKYKLERFKRKKQKELNEQKEKQMILQQSIESKERIKQLQASLVNLSTKLEQQTSLVELLKMKSQKSQKNSTQSSRKRQIRTQPDLDEGEQTQNPKRDSSFQIPENPLQRQYSPKKMSPPKVVYTESNKPHNDIGYKINRR